MQGFDVGRVAADGARWRVPHRVVQHAGQAWSFVDKAAQAGVPPEQLRNYSGSFVVNLMNYAEQVQVDVNSPVEIWNGGTGFMLIKREVFEQLKDHVPSYINDTHDLGGNIGKDRISEFFATSIEPMGERLLSEDYHFCKEWREKCGGTVWAAPWAKLAHIGTHMFDGILTQAPEQVPQPTAQQV